MHAHQSSSQIVSKQNIRKNATPKRQVDLRRIGLFIVFYFFFFYTYQTIMFLKRRHMDPIFDTPRRSFHQSFITMHRFFFGDSDMLFRPSTTLYTPHPPCHIQLPNQPTSIRYCGVHIQFALLSSVSIEKSLHYLRKMIF